jgi:hypothetical protein
MEIVLIILIFIGIALYLMIGYKGSKESKNNPNKSK